ncbi:MAG: ParB/RepB/Spo0J family partition protein [Nitrospirae bacterium]|nr:ParB/RepB/Spo0J family partition protein [Nitrospirota bacterium]
MSEFTILPLSSIVPAADNYRRIMDKKSLKELTESVKHKGVLQPILVRPVKGNGHYEIVAGHRRFQAATVAGLADIPVMVKDLTDEEALEVQVIENSQREDPNPMDEAVGFARLIEMGAHTPETLAAKLDRSVGYVLSRLRLLDIPEAAQKKIASGELPQGHALLLTRLKDKDDQKALLKAMLEDTGLTLAGAKEFIRRHFSMGLADAYFDVESCAACPLRSRNQVELFPDLKKTDECTDRECFFNKTLGHFENLLEEKKAEGFKTFTDPKDIHPLISSDTKATRAITGDKKEADWRTEVPRRYKSECMKCTEHHAYYLMVTEEYGGKRIQSGEICLNRKCLNKMQHPEQFEEKASASGPNPQNLRAKARECRDRFLLSALPAKVAENVTLQKRLSLFRLMDEGGYRTLVGDDRRPPFMQSAPRGYMDARQLYNLIARVPESSLDEVYLAVLQDLMAKTDTDVLLDMTEEAGIDLATEFVMDAGFLNSKTKAELAALVADLGLAVTLTGKEKKGEIVAAILALDLVGMKPTELVEVCAPFNPAERASRADGQQVCDICGCGSNDPIMEGVKWSAPNVCENCKETEGLRVCRVCGTYEPEAEAQEHSEEWAKPNLCADCSMNDPALAEEPVEAAEAQPELVEA